MNDEKWITVNGNHILIEEGETVKEAIDERFNNSKYTKTLYHGTDENFDEFSLDKFGKHDQGDFGKGIYFSEDKQTATKYGKNIKEVKVNIQNPYIINNHDDYKRMWKNFANNIDLKSLSKEDLELYNDPYIPEEDKNFMLYDTLDSDQKMNTFKNMGYDSIIDNTYHQVVVFDPNQIKNKN